MTEKYIHIVGALEETQGRQRMLLQTERDYYMKLADQYRTIFDEVVDEARAGNAITLHVGKDTVVLKPVIEGPDHVGR